MPANKQLQRPVIRRIAGAAHVSHYIVNTRRASGSSARPLNCGVSPTQLGV